MKELLASLAVTGILLFSGCDKIPVYILCQAMATICVMMFKKASEDDAVEAIGKEMFKDIEKIAHHR